MGELLTVEADSMVKATEKITLVDMDQTNSQKVTAVIQKQQENVERLAMQIGKQGLMVSQQEKMLRDLLEQETELEAAWSNKIDGRFIVSLPPAGIANAASRPWFKEASEGRNFVSPVYVSAISSRPCITIAVPVWSVEKSIIGVIGVDVKLV